MKYSNFFQCFMWNMSVTWQTCTKSISFMRIFVLLALHYVTSHFVDLEKLIIHLALFLPLCRGKKPVRQTITGAMDMWKSLF